MPVEIVGGSSGVSIGSAVSGGTPNDVLYIDSSGLLAQSSNFTWDETGRKLTLSGNSYIHDDGTTTHLLQIVTPTSDGGIEITGGQTAGDVTLSAYNLNLEGKAGTLIHDLSSVQLLGDISVEVDAPLFDVLSANSIFSGNLSVGGNAPRGILDAYGPQTTVGDVPSGTATQDNGAYHYTNFGYAFEYYIYAYKTVGTRKVFSATPFVLDFSDDGLTTSNYRILLSWGAVTGADGYVLRLTENDQDNKGEFSDGNYYYKDVGNVTTYTDNGASAFTAGGLPYSDASLQPNLYLTASGDVIWVGGSLTATGPYGFSPGNSMVPALHIKNTGNVLVLETATDPYAGTSGGVSLTLVNEDYHNGALFSNKSLDLIDFQFAGSSTSFSTNNHFSTIRWEGRNAYNRNSANNARGELQLGSTVDGDGIPAFCVGEAVVSLFRGKMSIRQSVVAPTAYLHLGGGTSTAATAPLKFTSGSNLTSAEAGAMEYTTPDLFFTPGSGVRYNLPLVTGAGSQGDLVYASGASIYSRLAKDTNSTRYLSNQGTSNNPSWNQINLANGVSGTLPVANGGTGSTVKNQDNIALTNQGADITTTNFASGGVAGTYRVSYVLEDTTADLTAGAVTLTIAFTDGAGATTVTANQVLTGVGRTSGSIYLQLTSGNVTYATSHTGIFGTAKYALYLTLERLS